MESFREFVVGQDQLDLILNEFNGTGTAPSAQAAPAAGVMPTSVVQQPAKQKPWSAKKDEILQIWKNLRGDTPIIIQPISDVPAAAGGEKSNYGEDGIRITGSWQFVSSVLSRLKELSYYENPQTKLRLVLRAVDKDRARADKQSFVFYLNMEKRTHGKPGRPNKNQTTPTLPTM